MQGSRKAPEQLQSPNQAAHPSLWRAQHGSSGAKAQALCAGLEGVLRVGANATGLAGAGRVAAPPPASSSSSGNGPRRCTASSRRSGQQRRSLDRWQATATAGGETATDWEFLVCHNLKLSNRPVRTRMPGGVAGAPPTMEAPYADRVISTVGLTGRFFWLNQSHEFQGQGGYD